MKELLFIQVDDKTLASGMRNTAGTLLTNEEIAFVKSEIRRIEADERVFVFNDEEHLKKSTCYNITQDVIYITRNVFPDEKYGSTHPRDIMSVAAVLAHEYYGHRAYRDEYLSDIQKGDGYSSVPYWQDECRASITAAKKAPNLTRQERVNLITDAIFRAKEFGQLIELDDFMKEVLYGYTNDEKSISIDTRPFTPIRFVSETGKAGNDEKGICNNNMPVLQGSVEDFSDIEW